MTRSKKLLTAMLAAFLITFTAVPSAFAGYEHFSEVPKNKDALIKKTIQKFMGFGFSSAAAAGMIGNINQESAFDPTLIERNSGYFKPLLESNPCNLTQSENTGAVGYFQLDGSRRTKMFCTMHKRGKKWTDLEAQINYALIDDFDKSKGGDGDPFKSSWYRAKIPKYCGAAGVSCPDWRSIKSVKDFKKLTDPKVAAVIWAAVWERCSAGSAGRLPLRASFANETYAKYKGLTPDPTAQGELGGGQKVNIEKGQVQGNGEIPNEEDLTGMPKRWDAPKGNVPKEVKYTDLTVAEQSALANDEERSKFHKTSAVGMAQIAVSSAGVLMVMYSVLLVAAAMVDKANNLIDISLVRILTLGKSELVYDKADLVKGTVLLKTFIARATLAFGIGMVVAGGVVFGLVEKIVMWVATW